MTDLPDIEIYVKDLPAEDVEAWLAQRFPAAEVTTRRRGKALQVLVADATGHTGATGPLRVLVMEQTADGFTSCWFSEGPMPWPSDLEAAREAWSALGREVRCSTGGWQPGDPEDWWQLGPDGEHRISWPDA